MVLGVGLEDLIGGFDEGADCGVRLGDQTAGVGLEVGLGGSDWGSDWGSD